MNDTKAELWFANGCAILARQSYENGPHEFFNDGPLPVTLTRIEVFLPSLGVHPVTGVFLPIRIGAGESLTIHGLLT